MNTACPSVRRDENTIIAILKDERLNLRKPHFVNHDPSEERQDDVWVGVHTIEEVVL
jgi:hypothetical protein